MPPPGGWPHERFLPWGALAQPGQASSLVKRSINWLAFFWA